MLNRITIVAGACLVLGAAEAHAWDRGKAFDHLESRQRRWAAWGPARKVGGPCISCHSGLSYFVAQRALGEAVAKPEESALVEGVVSRVGAGGAAPIPTLPDPGAEVVLNLLTLSLQRRDVQAPPSAAERAALDQLWRAQRRTGAAKGSWTWVDADLEPMDSPKAVYYGTALAARALAAFPGEAPDRVRDLRAYLERAAAGQPLHNRLAAAAFSGSDGRRLADAALRKLWTVQSPDGGFSTRALGPWTPRPDAPSDPGSNAYATAWATFTALEAGTPCADPRLKRALAWLDRSQDPETGAWHAPSMNKTYLPDSIQRGFMTDAATGFAAAALLACDPAASAPVASHAAARRAP
jgi:hypothetical protein